MMSKRNIVGIYGPIRPFWDSLVPKEKYSFSLYLIDMSKVFLQDLKTQVSLVGSSVIACVQASASNCFANNVDNEHFITSISARSDSFLVLLKIH